jgi:hypothetical protein
VVLGGLGRWHVVIGLGKGTIRYFTATRSVINSLGTLQGIM